MRFTAISTVLALATSVLAQTTDFDSINVPASVNAGSTTKISWTAPTHTDEDVKIELIGGTDASHLETKATIAASIKNSVLSFDWPVDSTLGKDATYGIRISLVSDASTFQYSNAFVIVGGAVASSSSSAAAPASYSVASASSSASVTVTVNLSTPTAAASTSAVASVTSAAASAESTIAPVSSASVIASTSVIGNLSSSATQAATTLKSAVSSAVSSATGSATRATTTAASTSVSQAGGAQATAGAVAMLGGLAVAMMAL